MTRRPNQPVLTRRAYLTAGGLTMTGVLSMLAGCNTLMEDLRSSTSDTATTTQTTLDSTTTQTTPPTATTQTTPTTGTVHGTASSQSLADVEDSQLQTYSNSTYGYRIKYPAGWTISDSQPANVSITPPESRESLTIIVDNVLPSTTIDGVIESISSSMETEYDEFRIVGRRGVTLPSGQSATVLDIVVGNTSGITLHGTICATITNRTVYMALGLVVKRYYPAAKSILNEIIESLTITA